MDRGASEGDGCGRARAESATGASRGFGDDALERMRRVGDPEVDALVRELYGAAPAAFSGIKRAMASVARNNHATPAELPDSLRELLARADGVGTAAGGWDERRLARGAAFFANYGALIPPVMQLVTMPTLYGARRAMRVLTFTGKLERCAHLRSIQTAQMVFDTMRGSGFRPRGYGFRAVQKVRLIHGAVRLFIAERGGWDEGELGVPINQEDLLGVLGAFSVGVVDALRRLGAEFSDDEAEDFYYRWRVVAELIGIREVPATLADMRGVFASIVRRQIAPSPEGRSLTRAWIEAVQRMTPPRYRALVEPVMADLLAAPVARAVGLEPSDPSVGKSIARRARQIGLFDRLLGRNTISRAVINRAADVAVRVQMRSALGARRYDYGLPARPRGGCPFGHA